MTNIRPRPWYCRSDAIEEHKAAIKNGESDTPMAKRTLTILRALLVNSGMIGISIYALRLGGDPTAVTIFALSVLAGYNGVEWSELMAFLQAWQEVQGQGQGQGGDDGSE